ncbi:hypothetical protein HA402_012964 [Bradysia odoriphaga]|nr:hypothetical protein HA402_012964 [Bradysia odoriphaga]
MTMALRVILVFSMLILCHFTLSLRITDLQIPEFMVKNSSVQLSCDFDLEGAELYSLKWFVSNHEFYRFVPNEIPEQKVFPGYGINVDLKNSSMKVVTIRSTNISPDSTFTCEVSSDAPFFDSVTQSGVIKNINTLPKQGPKITGLSSNVIGDSIFLICSSIGSKPAAQLTWLLNEQPINKNKLGHYIVTPAENNLEISSLGLNFVIDNNSFQCGSMKLKCIASIPNTDYNKSEEMNISNHANDTDSECTKLSAV